MTLANFIAKVNYTLRGIDDDTPNDGSEEWVYWLSLYTRKQDELYDDDTKNWSEAFKIESIGTVVDENTVSLDLPSDFISASDEAYVVKTDGLKTYFDVLRPNARVEGSLFIAGYNPQKIYLYPEPATALHGGTLWLPGYYRPAEVTDAGDVLPIPDPNWAISAVAAEIAFSDITYEDKAEGLQARANYLYSLMIKNNRRALYDKPLTTRYDVNRLRSY